MSLVCVTLLGTLVPKDGNQLFAGSAIFQQTRTGPNRTLASVIVRIMGYPTEEKSWTDVIFVMEEIGQWITVGIILISLHAMYAIQMGTWEIQSGMLPAQDATVFPVQICLGHCRRNDGTLAQTSVN